MKFQPMKAHVGSLEDLKKKEWLFEPKLDGVRAVCYVTPHGCSFISRNGLDVSRYFTQEHVPCPQTTEPCVLDGEIVACDALGRPSFGALQQSVQPVLYVIFDILEKGHTVLTNKPLYERKQVLADTLRPDEFFRLIPFSDDGLFVWKTMQECGWEGVMAKDPYGLYYPGERSYTWLKIKQRATMDAIILGYISSDKRTISSLALGLYNSHGQLRYIGNMGSGFNQKMLLQLERLLKPLTIAHKLVAQDTPKSIVWVKPKFVAEVNYMEVTRDGKLRMASFVRLRNDKKARECTMQEQDFKVVR